MRYRRLKKHGHLEAPRRGAWTASRLKLASLRFQPTRCPGSSTGGFQMAVFFQSPISPKLYELASSSFLLCVHLEALYRHVYSPALSNRPPALSTSQSERSDWLVTVLAIAGV